ncbi:MAG: DUF4124 domain-containing protein [Burkholderiales bacterium]
MRAVAAILLALLPAASIAGTSSGKLYRHLDDKGNIVFSDRPAQAGQAPEKMKAPNVASPDASWQIEAEGREAYRRAQEERNHVRRGEITQRQQSSAPPTRSGRYDPNLPDSQAPGDTTRRSYR